MSQVEFPILFYDGTCHLCNHSVAFILKHEKAPVIRFAMIQSSLGAEVKNKVENQWQAEIDSIIFSEKGKIWIKSSAALRISKYLKFPYSIAWYLRWVPRQIRDLFYDWIAQNRYSWFGKSNTCLRPDTNLKLRMLK